MLDLESKMTTEEKNRLKVVLVSALSSKVVESDLLDEHTVGGDSDVQQESINVTFVENCDLPLHNLTEFWVRLGMKEPDARANVLFDKWMKDLNVFVDDVTRKRELATKIMEEYELHQEGKDNAETLSLLINEAIELGMLYPSSVE